jgi:hypothetical protein
VRTILETRTGVQLMDDWKLLRVSGVLDELATFYQ